MNAKNATVSTAAGSVAILAGIVTYRIAKDSIKLRLADRKEKKLQKDIAALQRQLDKDANVRMVVRFETI